MSKTDPVFGCSMPSPTVSAAHGGDRRDRSKNPQGALRLPLGLAAVLVALAFLAAGCRQQMASQPSHRPLTASTFFRDQRSARPLVAGTIPRGTLEESAQFATGKADGSTTPLTAVAMLGLAASGPMPLLSVASQADPYVDEFPLPLDAKLLARGKERYDIFCSMCHDRTGYGKGMIVQRGYAPAPSYHIPRLRNAKAGYLFDVVTRGWGAMPSYSHQIPPRDRWAIVAYVRALQYSQNASPEDVPESEQAALKEGSR
jgi:mono/diheme cytochrome c family protein